MNRTTAAGQLGLENRAASQLLLNAVGVAGFGLLLGGLLIACDGVKIPGHRSFLYMAGFVAAQACLARPWLAVVGLIGGTMHFASEQSSAASFEMTQLFKEVLRPVALGLLWSVVRPRLPSRAGGFGLILAAALVCLLIPALNGGRSGKAWLAHPLMGALGTGVSAAACHLAGRRSSKVDPPG